MPSQHSIFPPSSMERLILCSASWMRSKILADKPATPVMLEGTQAHSVLESILKNKTVDTTDLPEDMLPAVEVCVDEVDRLRREWPGGEGIEMRVDLRWFGLEEVWGTVDYGRWNWLDGIKVLDYKHGQGVIVEPTSPQLLTYGAGLLSHVLTLDRTLNFSHLDLGIVQPRGKDYQPIKWHRISVADMFDWVGDVLAPSIGKARGLDPVATPGEKQCMWCQAKKTCPEFQQAAMDVMDVEFKDLIEVSQPRMPMLPTDPEVLGSVYEKLPLLKTWIKHIEGAVTNRLERSKPVPGYRLGQGKNSRKWKSEEAAFAKLQQMGLTKSELFSTPQFISPAQAEKLSGKKKELADLVKVIPGKPTIVKEGSTRRAYDPLLEEFSDLVKP